MPQFTVPKIEHELKIVGPLTLRQFVYVGIAGAVCFFFYFTLPLFFFILLSLPIAVAAIYLAFGKTGGRPAPEMLKNFFVFRFSPKIYLWEKRGGLPPKLIEEKKTEQKIEAKESPVPTAVGKSQLKNLSSQIEIKKY